MNTKYLPHLTLSCIALAFVGINLYVAVQIAKQSHIKAQALWNQNTQQLQMKYQDIYSISSLSNRATFSPSSNSGAKDNPSLPAASPSTPSFSLSSIVLDETKSKILVQQATRRPQWLTLGNTLDDWKLMAVNPFSAQLIHLGTQKTYILKLRESTSLPPQTMNQRRVNAFNSNITLPPLPSPSAPLSLPPLPPNRLPDR